MLSNREHSKVSFEEQDKIRNNINRTTVDSLYLDYAV